MSEETKSGPVSQRAQQPFFFTKTWFEELGLPTHVVAGLKDRGFTLCTPLQAQVIPLALSGKDVAAQAVTGTGKVAAYLLPLLARLPELSGKPQENTSALIIVPTSDLARTVADDLQLFTAGHTALSHALFIDEPDNASQAESLSQSPEIIIGTPAALVNHIRQGAFKVSTVNELVIDEADRFFHLGLTRDLRYLLRKLPYYEKRRSILFSSVLSYRVLALAYHYLNSPEFVSGVAEESQLAGMEQCLFHVDSREKGSLLLGILRKEEWRRALVFANTPASADGLMQILKGNGLPVEFVPADLPQRKRFRLMARLNRGGERILVTTDAAAGAVYVEGVSHVINYDLPLRPENYVQRAGRITTLNGRRCVISFACEEYVFHLEPIEESLGYKIPVVQPRDDWFVGQKDVTLPVEQPAKPQEPQEEKKSLQLRGGARIAFSSSPGGVFGLAPERVSTSEKGAEGKRKGRRHRSRRPPAKE